MFVLIRRFLLTMICMLLTVPVMALDSMSDTAIDTLQGMSDLFSRNLSTSQALGKPFEAGEYTVIPVVARGVGFGLGTKQDSRDSESAAAGKNENHLKDRLGLGGAGFVKPVALIMIRKNGDFKVVRLGESFFAQLARHLVPAVGSMLRKTIKTLSAEKMKHDRARRSEKKQKAEKKPLAENMQKGSSSILAPLPTQAPPAKN